MGNLSTFGTFTMARLGIYVSQHALNVTGNNISNINTKGYTRQELDQTAMSFGGADKYQSRFDIRENGGVMARGVDQIRDKYLDIRYRNEMTRVGEMDEKLAGLNKLAVIFDEVGKGEDEAGVLEARFNDLIQQLETHHTQGAGKDDFDSIVRKSAEALVTQFHDYATQLQALAETQDAEFRDDLESVNATLKKIRNLNESIRMSEAFGGSALTQKDERNLLIDELSEKIGINVIYERESIGEGIDVEKLKITTAGMPERTLIDGIYGAQLSIAHQYEIDFDGHSKGDYVDEKDLPYALENEAAIESPNYDLVISKLRDAHGNTYPADIDVGALVEAESYSASAVGGYDTHGTYGSYNSGYATLQAAQDAAAAYNANASYTNINYGGETYTASYIGVEVRDPNTNNVIGYEVRQSRSYVSGPTYSQADAEKYVSELNAKAGSAEYSAVASGSGYTVQKGGQTYRVSVTAGGGGGSISQTDEPTIYSTRSAAKAAITRAEARGLTDLQIVDNPTGGYMVRQIVEQSKQVVLGDTELSGGLQAEREILTEKGEYSSDETIANVDPDAGTKRGIPYYQAALDTLARKFAELMNEANRMDDQVIYKMNDAGDKFIDGSGTEITTKFVDDEGNALTPPDPKGKYTVDDADRGKLVLKSEYSYYDGGVLFSNKGTNNDPENITAANISISYNWDHGSVHMLRTTKENAASEDQDNLRHFVSLLTQRHDFTNGQNTQGTTYFNGTFQEMLTDTIAGTLAKDQNITKTMLDNYNATADELYVDRDSVMGVDLNDEAMNMMQFQKAYAAACRLMTTYDGMLDKLINGMAV